MKSDISVKYRLGLTKEEKEIIEKFCQFMADVMDWEDNYERIYDIIDSIGYRNQSLLNKMHFEIYDIDEEKKKED